MSDKCYSYIVTREPDETIVSETIHVTLHLLRVDCQDCGKCLTPGDVVSTTEDPDDFVNQVIEWHRVPRIRIDWRPYLPVDPPVDPPVESEPREGVCPACLHTDGEHDELCEGENVGACAKCRVKGTACSCGK